MTFKLFVPGRPVPQGSKTAFVSKSTGRPVVVDKDVRLPQWRAKITAAALSLKGSSDAIDGPVGARVTFVFERPLAHMGSGKNIRQIKKSAPKYPAVMPDLDKLLRAVFDGITDAQLIRDDSQIVYCVAQKRYVDDAWPGGQGVHIAIGPMP